MVRNDDSVGTEPDSHDGELDALVRAVAKTPTNAFLKQPGDSFCDGRYRVERILGQGGQKLVFLVHDTALDRQCALSLVQPALIDAPHFRRFELEARALAKVSHPNIVTVYDLGDEGGAPFLLCEYLEGGDLQSRLSKKQPLGNREALVIVRDVCRALAFAHEAGVIHRDIKPGNIWMLKDGTAKLGDFGLALVSGNTRLTQGDGMLGTAMYLSPEQALGKPVDPRTDLYSLGGVLYELLTGEPPFVADSAVAVISQHIHCEPKPPEEHVSELDARVSSFVLRLLAKDPDQRPASAQQVLMELDRLLTVPYQAAVTPPMPHNERERLVALHGLGILDTPPEAAYNEIVELATQICECPAGYVCFVDETRQWMKARVGFPDELREAPREIGICQTTICQSDMLISNDLKQDPRFSELPPVAGPPHFRYYCGAPLITAEGYALGTLVVMDFEPRELSLTQVDSLRRLARQVCAQIELRKIATELDRARSKVEELEQAVTSSKARSEALLETVVPKPLQCDAQSDEHVAPRYYEQLTLGVVRVSGFAELASTLSPAALFESVDAVVAAFDEEAKRYGLEKLKTFADHYSFVAGLGASSRRHPLDSCLGALALRAALRKLREKLGHAQLEGVRVGLHTGSAIGGNAGTWKMAYDVWGTNVNLAAALATSGAPDDILVSHSTHERVRDFFDFEEFKGHRQSLPSHARAYRLLGIKQALVDDTATFDRAPSARFELLASERFG